MKPRIQHVIPDGIVRSIRPYILGTAYRVKRYRPGTWFIVGDCTVKEEEEGSMKPVYGATPPLADGAANTVAQVSKSSEQSGVPVTEPSSLHDGAINQTLDGRIERIWIRVMKVRGPISTNRRPKTS